MATKYINSVETSVEGDAYEILETKRSQMLNNIQLQREAEEIVPKKNSAVF